MGSALAQILKALRETDYYTVFDLINTADHGVPQTRQRVVFIGSRDGRKVVMPRPTHGMTDGAPGWRTLRDALAGLSLESPRFTELSPSKRHYMALVPEGGNWRDLPKRMQAKALGGAFASWGGRTGFYRRLGWDQPAPALTTRPDSKATMLCHPEETRPLSVQEYARVQQFPDDWDFVGSVAQQYQQVGNAVPLGLGEAVGRAVKAAARNGCDESRLGEVACASAELSARIRARPRTVLNPPRMRKEKGLGAARKWMKGRGSGRRGDLLAGFLVLGADGQER